MHIRELLFKIVFEFREPCAFFTSIPLYGCRFFCIADSQLKYILFD
jgi:hypothetical protein